MTTKFDKTSGLPIGLDTTVIGETTYVAGQEYTAYGEPTLTTRKIAGGVYTQDDTEYDTVTRRVTRTRVKPETATGSVSDRRYDYDAVGNILSIREAPQVGQADNQCFRYDALRRLTSAWTPTGTDCAADPTVATLGGPAPYWTDWSFDAIGNRTQQVTHTAAGNVTQAVTVPDSGPGAVRPHSASQVTTAAPGQSPVTRAYGYDATGNTTSRPGPAGNSQALTWDAEGKAVTAIEGTSKVSNVYDAEGERLIRRDPTGTTLYLPGVELRRQDGATTGTRYYSFAGKTVAQRTKAGGLVWVYSDHQGTQQVMVHALTQKVTIRRQTPYGEPRGENPAWPNGKGFVGGDIDPTGLTHVGAREYDATLGRFISVDPVMDLTDPQQWNAYTYANSNPTTHSDPSGKCIPEYCNAQAQQDLKTDPYTGEWKDSFNFPVKSKGNTGAWGRPSRRARAKGGYRGVRFAVPPRMSMLDQWTPAINQYAAAANIDPALLLAVLMIEVSRSDDYPLVDNMLQFGSWVGEKMGVYQPAKRRITGGDGPPSIGWGNIQQQAFNETVARHGDEFSGVEWTDLMGNHDLSIKATAYRLRDLQDYAEETATGLTRRQWTPGEVAAAMYNVGTRNYREALSTYGTLGPNGSHYAARVRSNFPVANTSVCSGVWSCS